MVKLINEYGITVTPSHVYKCDTKEDFANIPSPCFGDVAYVIHGEDGGEVYIYDSNSEWVLQ